MLWPPCKAGEKDYIDSDDDEGDDIVWFADSYQNPDKQRICPEQVEVVVTAGVVADEPQVEE